MCDLDVTMCDLDVTMCDLDVKMCDLDVAMGDLDVPWKDVAGRVNCYLSTMVRLRAVSRDAGDVDGRRRTGKTPESSPRVVCCSIPWG